MSKKILIIRLSSIGDVIHCTPVARGLKAAWPDCRITWLIGEVCADLIKYNPFIDEIIIWPRERFDKHLQNYEFAPAFALWRSLQTDLAAKEFYAVLDIHGLFLTGMISRQVNTGQRIGMSQARELNPLFMDCTAKPLGPHITERYLSVLRPLGVTPADQPMTLVIPPEAGYFADNYLRAQGIITPQDKVAVLVPGTTWPAKNWPPELFAKAAKMLAKDFKVILCGGKAEVPAGHEIEAKAGVGVNNAIGQTSLLEMAGIIGKAAVVVAGDTGPLYMAAALGTPTVGLFGPTNPETYAPPGKHNAIVVAEQDCGFCHKTKCRHGTNKCMNSIMPEAVVEQVYKLVT